MALLSRALHPFASSTIALSLLLLLPAAASNSPSGDWPGFRGPDQNGGVLAPGLFEGETIGLAPAWSQRLGSGYAGISVADGRVFTMAAIGDHDMLVAVDAERGVELWRYQAGPRTFGHDGSEDGPSPTPVVGDGLLHSVSATGRLFTLDVDSGKELWSVDLIGQFEAQLPSYDYVASPAVMGDVLVALAPKAPAGALVAFDRRTGKHLWSAAPGDGEYGSPIAATVLGQPQFIIWHEKSVQAVDPDGATLWSSDFGPNSDASPVIVEDDRVLLKGPRSSALYQLSRAEDGSMAAAQLWESRDLKGSMSAPVYFDGHIYGFDTRFLSCIDAATGKRVWKSRPPGGSGLILVEDRLVVFAADGQIAIVKASPEGYQEETRYKATERESLTWPAFAAGKVFVRDATHLAAVRITDQPTPVSNTDTGPPVLYEGTEFTAFVERATASAHPEQHIDAFFRQPRSYPIVESNFIHFVYRGQATDVAVSSTIWDSSKEFPLEQLGETGFFYRTMKLDPMTRLEYAFRVNLESLVPDPLNPRQVERFPGSAISEVVPPGWQDPPWIEPYDGTPKGTTETLVLTSEHTSDTREIELWRPVEGAPQGLLLVLDGAFQRSVGRLETILDHLVGESVAPIAVAFVPERASEYWVEADGKESDELAAMLARELVPLIEQTLGRELSRDQVAVVGIDMWASAALHTGLLESERIGQTWLLDYAGTLTLERELVELLEAPPSLPRSRFLMSWNRHGTMLTDRVVGHEEARALAERLDAAGYEVDREERLDSAGWGAYRSMMATLLETTFPLAP